MASPTSDHGGSPRASAADGELERLVRVDEIVSAAMERARSGQGVSIDEIVDEHPDIADELRAALRAVASMERTVQRVADDGAASPTLIGTYEVVRELGRGGMGIVYEAYDPSLDRRVAIKLLPRTVSQNRSFVERFDREAHIAARLEHPHVLPVHGFGVSEGRRYLVMKLVDGHGLDELMKLYLTGDAPPDSAAASGSSSSPSSHSGTDGEHRARRLARQLAVGRLGSFGRTDETSVGDDSGEPASVLPALGRSYHRNVARVGLAVADALAYAHARGVLHRDIKPGNILVDRRGSVWVTDFGLAKIDEADDLTRDGDLVGTLRYMAPEQFEGHAESRSDVYSLGLLLYEMLTLQRAMKADSRAELIHEVLYVVPRSPEKVRSVVPNDLARIVMKAIAKLPQERYRTAQAMAADLRAYLDGRPIAAREPSVLYLTRVAVNRNRPLFAAIVALLVAIAVGAIAYVAQLRTSADAETRLAYRANLAAAAASLENSDVPTALARLLDCPDDRRGWEWDHLEASLDQSLRTIAAVGAPARGLRYDGDRIVISHRRATTVVTGGEREDIVFPGGTHRQPDSIDAWPYEGGWLAFQYRTGFWRTPFEGFPSGGVPDLEAEPMPGFMNLPVANFAAAVAFQPDAGVAVACERNGDLIVVDPAAMAVVSRAPSTQDNVEELCLSVDGRTCWTASLDGTVVQWNLGDMTQREVFVSPAGIRGIDVSTDESMLAVAGVDHSVYLVLLENPDEEIYQFVGHEGGVTAVAFSRDGTLLASSGLDKRIRVWDIETGSAIQVMNGHARGVAVMEFNEAGDRFLSGSLSGTVKEWHVGASGGRTQVHGHLADVAALDFADSGDRFATGARDGTIRITDAASLRLDAVLVGHGGELNGVVWHDADRRLLAVDRSGRVVDWDVARARPRWDLQLRGVAVLPAMTRDGSAAFVGGYSGEVARVRIEDGEVLASIRLEKEGVGSIALAPREDELFVGTLTGDLLCLDAETLEERRRVRRHDAELTHIEIDPAGNRMATTSLDGTVALSPVTQLEAQTRTRLGGEGLAWNSDGLDAACFSPDGRLLAVASYSWLVRVLDAETGDPVIDLAGHRDWVRCLAFSPDGRTLVSTGSYASVRIWDARTTSDRERALRERLDLEEAGRALVESWLDREVVDPDDVAAALERVETSGTGHPDLQRATRAILYQQRDRHIFDYLERRLLEDGGERSIGSADQFLEGWARRLPMDMRTHRLGAVTRLVDGDLDGAAQHLADARSMSVDGGRFDAVLLATGAALARRAGDDEDAERQTVAANIAIASAAAMDQRTARMLLAL